MQKDTFESRLGLRDDLSLSLQNSFVTNTPPPPPPPSNTTTTTTHRKVVLSRKKKKKKKRKSVAFSFLWSFFVFFLFCVVACVVRIQFVFGETD